VVRHARGRTGCTPDGDSLFCLRMQPLPRQRGPSRRRGNGLAHKEVETIMGIDFWVAIPVVALLIPITAIIADAYKKVKEKEQAHEARIKAIEAGIGDPAALLATPVEVPKEKPKGRGAAYHGAIWTGLGLGLLISTLIVHEIGNEDMRGFASFLLIWAIPAFTVGLGLVIYGVKTKNGNGSA
jgi:hypothetical protein